MLYYTKTWLNLNWRHQLHILLIVIVRGLSSLTQQYIVVVKHIFIFLHFKNWNKDKFSFLMMFFLQNLFSCKAPRHQPSASNILGIRGERGKGERGKGERGEGCYEGIMQEFMICLQGGGGLMHLMLWCSILHFIHTLK